MKPILLLFCALLPFLAAGCVADAPEEPELAALTEADRAQSLPQPIPDTDPDFEVTEEYTQRRNQALQYRTEAPPAESPEQATEHDHAEHSKLIALLVESGASVGVETMFIATDGTAELFYSNGDESVVAVKDETTQQAIDRMLVFSQEYVEKATLTDKYPLPHERVTRFYLITNHGVHAGAAADDDLYYDKSPFSYLMYGAKEMKSMIQEQQTKPE